jgi:hypothetical protein
MTISIILSSDNYHGPQDKLFDILINELNGLTTIEKKMSTSMQWPIFDGSEISGDIIIEIEK